MIVGLTSNMGDSSFTIEPCATHESDIVCDVVLVTSPVVGDYDLNSTVLTAQLPLSIIRLRCLLGAIDRWLATDVRDAAALDGKHLLVDHCCGRLDLEFGRRSGLIAAVEKPTVTIRYRIGRSSGELVFVTDQSCLREFADDLRQVVWP